MPTRSFYFPPDFEHVAKVLLDAYGPAVEAEINRFRAMNLPPLIDERSLGFILSISDRLVHVICTNKHKHYRHFELNKSDGSKRPIDAPRTYLKVIQWWINDNILSRIPVSDNVFGFVRGRSVVDNARFHRNATRILNVDIENFFPSIHRSSVYAVFQSLGYAPAVAAQLADVCTLHNALPQGAPTSPTIANLAFREADKELLELSSSRSILYSRYADDLTFSSNRYIDQSFVSDVNDVLSTFGFRLKRAKTRFSGQNARMEITGLTVNEYIHPSREWRRKTRALLYNYSISSQLSDLEFSRLNGLKGILSIVEESPSVRSLKRQLERVSELHRKPPKP